MMHITFFSFAMSLLWFNLYIVAINFFRKSDKFIISFSTFPLVFFLILSVFRLVFNFDIPNAKVIGSRKIFPKIYDFIRDPISVGSLKIDLFQFFILVWVIVAAVLIVKSLLNYIKFKSSLDIVKKNRSLRNQSTFNEILRSKRLDKKIEVIQHDKIKSPFILGIASGEIYIPNIYFSRGELEDIISHEVNHFVGNDSIKKTLIHGIKYIFWWNPFAHLFANNFNHILEIQCDLKTTAKFSKEEKISYLESITKVVNNQVDDARTYQSVPNLINIGDMDSLKQRFRVVLNYKGKKNLFKLYNFALCTLAVGFFISSYFLIIQPDYQPVGSEKYYEEDSQSFIIESPSGKYDIYINDTFQYSVENLENLSEKLENLPIYKGNGGRN